MLNSAYKLGDNYEHKNRLEKTNFFQYRNALRFLNAFDNTIYTLKEDSGAIQMIPQYEVDFGRYNIPEEFDEQPFNDIREYYMSLADHNYAHSISGYFEDQNYVMFCFSFKGNLYKAIFLKEKGETLVVDEYYDDLLFDGLSFSPRKEWFDYHYSNGNLYLPIDYVIFKEKIDEVKNNSAEEWATYIETHKEMLEVYESIGHQQGVVIAILSPVVKL